MDLDALIAHLALDSGRLALAIVMAQSKLAIALGPQRSQNCDRIGADPMAGLDRLAGGSGHRRESRDWRMGGLSRSRRGDLSRNQSGATGPSGYERQHVHAVNRKQGFQPDGRGVRRVYGAPSCASGEIQVQPNLGSQTCFGADAVLVAGALRIPDPARKLRNRSANSAVSRRTGNPHPARGLLLFQMSRAISHE